MQGEALKSGYLFISSVTDITNDKEQFVDVQRR